MDTNLQHDRLLALALGARRDRERAERALEVLKQKELQAARDLSAYVNANPPVRVQL